MEENLKRVGESSKEHFKPKLWVCEHNKSLSTSLLGHPALAVLGSEKQVITKWRAQGGYMNVSTGE